MKLTIILLLLGGGLLAGLHLFDDISINNNNQKKIIFTGMIKTLSPVKPIYENCINDEIPLLKCKSLDLFLKNITRDKETLYVFIPPNKIQGINYPNEITTNFIYIDSIWKCSGKPISALPSACTFEE